MDGFYQGGEALGGNFFADLFDLVKTRTHLFMHLVNGTTANRIMRVALDQQAPGGKQNLLGVGNSIGWEKKLWV